MADGAELVRFIRLAPVVGVEFGDVRFGEVSLVRHSVVGLGE